MPELSWSWQTTLQEGVHNGGEIKLPLAADFNPEAADTAKSQVAVSNVVYGPARAPLSFDADEVTIANLTGFGWSTGELVYAYVPRKGAAQGVEAVQAQLDDHEARIKALEGAAKEDMPPPPKPEHHATARVTAKGGGTVRRR